MSTNAYTQPDSIVQWKNSILIGFQNHVAKDATHGKSSTIVQYSLDSNPERTFSVPGHNDGLRIVGESDLWCLQNEDANPNLVVIDLESGKQKIYTFAATPHGGGYDDMIVQNGQVFMTASDPNQAGGINIFRRSRGPVSQETRLSRNQFCMVMRAPSTSPRARQ